MEKLSRIESQLFEYLVGRLGRDDREQAFEKFDQLSFLHSAFNCGRLESGEIRRHQSGQNRYVPRILAPGLSYVGDVRDFRLKQRDGTGHAHVCLAQSHGVSRFAQFLVAHAVNVAEDLDEQRQAVSVLRDYDAQFVGGWANR